MADPLPSGVQRTKTLRPEDCERLAVLMDLFKTIGPREMVAITGYECSLLLDALLAVPDVSRPEQDETMDKRTTGLYNKFDVHRTDGTDLKGKKHDGCEYFVLDLDHDPHARLALHAYAESCRKDYPKLAEDLVQKAMTKPFGAAKE